MQDITLILTVHIETGYSSWQTYLSGLWQSGQAASHWLWQWGSCHVSCSPSLAKEYTCIVWDVMSPWPIPSLRKDQQQVKRFSHPHHELVQLMSFGARKVCLSMYMYAHTHLVTHIGLWIMLLIYNNASSAAQIVATVPLLYSIFSYFVNTITCTHPHLLEVWQTSWPFYSFWTMYTCER